jgi:hypothetical protein
MEQEKELKVVNEIPDTLSGIDDKSNKNTNFFGLFLFKLKINWRIFLLVVIPPLFFAWPWYNNTPFPFSHSIPLILSSNFVDVASSTPPIYISFKSDVVANQTVISSILNVNIKEIMPTKVCVENKNKIFIGDKEIDNYSNIPNDVGAISIKIPTLHSNSKDFYVTIGKRDCDDALESFQIPRSIDIRNPIPFDAKTTMQDNEVVIQVTPTNQKVKVFTKPIYIKIVWKTEIFIHNLLIIGFAWIILLSSIFTLFDRIYNRRYNQK